MAATDVIFNIGVVGAKASMSDVSGLISKFKEIKNNVYEAVTASDRYYEAFNRLSIGMGQFNSQTKGLIDTMTSVQQANALTAAKVNLTSEEFATLGKGAIEMGKKLGVDATSMFERLTNAVIRGSERGLLPFGIQLDETEDKVIAQAEALKKLTERFGDYTVEVETLTDKTYAFQNTMGTLADQLSAPAFYNFIDWISGAESGFDNLSKTMASFSDDLTKGGESFAQWITSSNGILNTMSGTWAEIWGNTEDARIAAKNYYIELENAKRKNMKGSYVGTKRRQEQDAAQIQNALDLEEIAAAESKYDLNKEFGKKKGGSKKKDKTATTAFDAGLAGEDILGLLDFTTPAEEAAAAKMQMIDTMSAQTQERWMSAQEAQMLTADQYRQQEIEAEKVKYDALNGYEKQLYDNKKAWAEMSQADQMAFGAASLSTVSGFLGQAASLQDKDSKKGFNTAKNLNMAQVAMETPAAAISAYKSLAGIPYVGPGLGLAAAAAATAFGFAQMARIKETKFGGGASVNSASASAPSTPSISSLGANNYGSGSQSGSTTLVSNIILDGNVIHRSMLRSNADAAQRGEESFTTA